MVGSRLNQIPGRVIAIATAALVSLLAGSTAASSAQPVAHPGIGQAIAGAGPVWLPGRGELAPEPGNAAGLLGVFCTSAARCWTVGNFERNGAWLNEAMRWDGHRWSQVAAPSPGGTASGDFSELLGVRCTASANCWAVGSYDQHGARSTRPCTGTARSGRG